MILALRAFALSALLVLGLTGRAAAELDEMSKLIVAYAVTLPTTQKVATFYEALATWAKGNPKEVAALQKRDKGGSLETAIAMFETNPTIRKLLDGAGIGARDAILLPLSVASSGAIVMAEERGMQMPPEAVNRRNVELMKREPAAMEGLFKRITAARATLEPKR